ncbi:MAG: hypothetical protein JWO77_1384 [Ilumatobacteraceae bacterium]|nr:hypothetical protein [Ilumatobacteraceae bacterium]
MPARCVNGHDTPGGAACMYCGAPLVPAAPIPRSAYAPPPQPIVPRPGSGGLSALAVASLVLSLFFPFGAVPAVIVGFIALPRIRRRNQDGRGLAIAGIVIGGVVIALGLVAAVVVFAVGGTVEEPDSTENCRTEARTIRTASEALYASEGRYPLTMDELVDANLLRRPSERYDLRPNDHALPDLVPIDGQCSGVTVPGG